MFQIFKKIFIHLLLLPRTYTFPVNGNDGYMATTSVDEPAVQKELLFYAKYLNKIPNEVERAEFRGILHQMLRRALENEMLNGMLNRMLGKEQRCVEEEQRRVEEEQRRVEERMGLLKNACKPIVISQRIRSEIENLPVYGVYGATEFRIRRDIIINTITNFRNKRPKSLFNAIKVFCFYADANQKNATHTGALQYAYKKLKSLNLHLDEELKKTYLTFDETLLEKIKTLNNTSNFDDAYSKWSSDIQYWNEKKHNWGVKNINIHVEDNSYPDKMEEKEKGTFELISDFLSCIEDILPQLKLKTIEEVKFATIQLSQPKSLPPRVKDDPKTYKSCLWVFCHSTTPHFQTALNIFKNISKISSDELSTINMFCMEMVALGRLNSLQFFHKKDFELYEKVPIESSDVDKFAELISRRDLLLKAVIYSVAYLANLIY